MLYFCISKKTEKQLTKTTSGFSKTVYKEFIMVTNVEQEITNNNKYDVICLAKNIAELFYSATIKNDTLFFIFEDGIPKIMKDMRYDLFIACITYEGPMFRLPNNQHIVYHPVTEDMFKSFINKLHHFSTKYLDYVQTIL